MSSACNCSSGKRTPGLDKLAVFGVAVSFLVLTLTGLSVPLLKWKLTGYLLLAHTSMGGLFAVSLALLALVRAGRPGAGLLHGFFFWLLLVTGFGLIVTASLMMLPVLSSDDIHGALSMHRYLSYFAVGSGVLYCLLSCRKCRE
jgi:hypothetical protein